MSDARIKRPAIWARETWPYWVTLYILLGLGPIALLHYVLLLAYMQIVGGAYARPSRWWKAAAIFTSAAALLLFGVQLFQYGPAGWPFRYSTDDSQELSGQLSPSIGVGVNVVTLLGLTAVFLPLSIACVVDRLYARFRPMS
ncbi:hypothetical protein [Stratiformator vulcanicus]|uniref:Uncharacterized protein n=1 Tax=Stratiformator vulcanicus TaxID=2527980 RepID=A0A517R143_9PLAN|nr:hypothetical protein [Stratiformator vulcanicus]QDT37615.1 hypothetical protein Pan189_19950 [Stratiformator vulcanicus]